MENLMTSQKLAKGMNEPVNMLITFMVSVWKITSLNLMFSGSRENLPLKLIMTISQSVQSLSCVRLFETPWMAAHQASPSITISRSSLSLTQTPSSPWGHLAISSSVIPFSSCPQSLRASESFPMSQLFAWGGQSTGVSALESFLPRTSRADLLQNGLVGSPCSPRDSQESTPTPQFKCINSSELSLLHSPTVTSIHDYRKNHSLD